VIGTQVRKSLMFLFALLTPVMHSQVEMLALQPTEALQARYNALQDAYWKTNDLATLKSILAEEDPISNELIR